jgi:DNA polymerase III psi subunit
VILLQVPNLPRKKGGRDMPDKARLAKINIAKKELRLTDEVYRDILSLHFQVESAVQLTDRQVTVLLNRFRAMGWEAKASPKMRPDPFCPEDGKKGLAAL